jgi:hypothetical protein
MEKCIHTFVPNLTRRMNRYELGTHPTKKKIKYRKTASHKKRQKYAITLRKEEYCNPGCKGTIFQDGTFTQKELEDMVRRNPFSPDWTEEDFHKIVAIYKQRRSKMFRKRNGTTTKKRSVLNRDFYEKLGETRVAKLKKQGAISGCGT